MLQEKAVPASKPFPRSHLHCMLILQVAVLITMAVSMSMGLDTWSNGFSAGLVTGLYAGAVVNTIYFLRK